MRTTRCYPWQVSVPHAPLVRNLGSSVLSQIQLRRAAVTDAEPCRMSESIGIATSFSVWHKLMQKQSGVTLRWASSRLTSNVEDLVYGIFDVAPWGSTQREKRYSRGYYSSISGSPGIWASSTAPESDLGRCSKHPSNHALRFPALSFACRL